MVSDPVGKDGQKFACMVKEEAERGKRYVILGRGNRTMNETMGNEDCFVLWDKSKKNIKTDNVRITSYYGAFA